MKFSTMRTGITAGSTVSGKAKETEAAATSAFVGTKEEAYNVFTSAARGITLTMGADADDYRLHQAEDLKPMRHSIRIAKKPKNLDDPRIRLWKLKHLGAVKKLGGEVKEEERPIDEALMARIQGIVFKTLRPRSIKMHLEARRLYRVRKRKEEREGLTLAVKETNLDVGRGHQLWLEALDQLECKPLEAPI